MYDWSEVDFKKNDREIADDLGCTPQAVYAHRKSRGIPFVAGPRGHVKRTNPVLLNEPIDYEGLASAFRSASWKWFDGYPTPERLKRRVEAGKAYMENRFNSNDCNNSGGINIQRLDGKIVVLIHGKLSEHYHQSKDFGNK